MKKILFWAAVTILAVASCNKIEEGAPVGESNVPTFEASVDGADTKTIIDGLKSYWDGNEGIRVLDGKLTNGKVYTTNVEKAETATFVEKDGSVALSGDDYLAVYPEGPAGSVTWDGNVANAAKKFWLPGEQNAVLGSYDPSTHIAVAYTTAGNNNLEFKNVTSLVKFTLKGNNVKEVCFYGNNSDVIAGNFDVTYNDGKPAVNTKNQYNETFAKVVAKTGNLKPGTYYISVLPCIFAKGFGIEAIDKTYEFKSVKKNSKSYTLNRNEILDLGEIEWNGKIYLNAGGSGLWDQGSAWFSAYFMDSNKNTTKWVTLTKNKNGIYEGNIPDGTWKYVIFVRNNPVDKVADWTNVWNQTADLEIQKINNLYTITGWSYGDWSENK